MKRSTAMLRALLGLLLLLLLAALAVVGVLAYQTQRNLPAYTALAWATYVGIVLGFVPVVLAMWRMHLLAGLVARDEAFSEGTVREIHRIKQYIVWFIAWFLIGAIGFRIALGFLGPVIGAVWLILEVAATFLFVVVAILERLFVAATRLREDAELTV